MKIIFLRHTISHLWQKIAIVWAIFGHFWHVFSDFLLSVTQLCSLWEPFQPEHSWPMWGNGFGPFLDSRAINLWLGGVKNGYFYGKNSPYWRAGSRSKKPTWKLFNGPYHIPIHGKTLLRAIKAFSRYHFRSAWVQKMAIFRVKTHTMSVNVFGRFDQYWYLNTLFLCAHHL